MTPLSVSTSKAIRWFNFCRSLPKTASSAAAVVLGLKKSKNWNKPTALIFSISEDYARLWHHFAKKHLPSDQWHILIVDSSGEMKKGNFNGAEIVKYTNFPHGRKMDIIIKKFVRSDIIFLSDDDKYITFNPSEELRILNNPAIAAISFAPRKWYRLNVNGFDFEPLGNCSVLWKRELILKHHLSFERIRNKKSPYKIFQPGAKEQESYDIGDIANEKILLAGYKTLVSEKTAIGFDGLSAPRIFLMRYGKKALKEALESAPHYKWGSINGAQLRGIYGIVKFESLFKYIFNELPAFQCGFSSEEIRDIVFSNQKISEENKKETELYFDKIDRAAEELKNYA